MTVNAPEILMSGRVGKILVIDDDPDNRLMLERCLRSVGYAVALASDVRDGMRQFQAEPADLVITDIFMPAREGLEMLLELRHQVPELTLIAMSSRIIGSTILCLARHLGAVATLQKPVSRDELLGAIENAALKVSQSRLHQAAA